MAADDRIRIAGAREHNLKDISLELPRDALIVITGLSGSGKSSLAFDTIYAEGQRRYVESLSAYARQFLGQMDKPDVDSIEGLSPAISIDQKTTSRNPRSTVGTVTEIYDYLRLLWARVGHPHCHNCGKPIAGQSIEQIIDHVMTLPEGTRFMVLAPVVRGRKGEYKDLLEELRAEGFTRAKVDGELRLLEEEIELDKKFKHDIAVVVDRLVMKPDARKRLADSVETAVALAEGIVEIRAACGDESPAGPRRDGRSMRRARRRPRRDGHARLLGEVRLPELRHLDARARAADLLVQLAARRLPALHRPRLADGDRPRPRGPDPSADDQRGRDPALELRARTTTSSSMQAIADKYGVDLDVPWEELPEEDQDLFLCGRRGRARVRLLPQPDGAAALLHGADCEGVVPHLERRYRDTDSDCVARADRGVHVGAALSRVQGRAAAAGEPGGQGRRPRHPRVHAQVGARGDRVPRRDRAERRPSSRSRAGS